MGLEEEQIISHASEMESCECEKHLCPDCDGLVLTYTEVGRQERRPSVDNQCGLLVELCLLYVRRGLKCSPRSFVCDRECQRRLVFAVIEDQCSPSLFIRKPVAACMYCSAAVSHFSVFPPKRLKPPLAAFTAFSAFARATRGSGRDMLMAGRGISVSGV